MENAAPRFDMSSLVAACIIAVALLAAALIVTQRPTISGGNPLPALAGSAPAAKPMSMPPITQASAQEQFRAQVLAAPTLHTFLRNGKAYTLTDVKVERVVYSAKDDNFSIVFTWVWQPAMPGGDSQSDSATLNNDGYGHYYGSGSFRPAMGGNDESSGSSGITYITIK